MAARFWVAQPISNAIVSVTTPPQIRLTVASTTGMTTGDVRVVAGVVGTTEANGTWTITVIDATHVDLQGTTFSNVYSSGGTIIGKWDATNANNWVSTTGGSNYGQTVPGSADTVTFDGSSGAGTVIVNTTVSVTSITMNTFTGTLDFSVNNNNVNLVGGSTWSNTGTSTRTLNMGNGTWTVNCSNINAWTQTTLTGLTFNANSSTLVFTGNFTSTNARSIVLGAGLTYSTVAFNANTSGSTGGTYNIQGSAGTTIGTLNITGPNSLSVLSGSTLNVTNGLNINSSGSITSVVGLISSTTNSLATISSANTGTLNYCVLRDMAFTGGGTFTSNNSIDVMHNTGITINPPTIGGGGVVGVIGS